MANNLASLIRRRNLGFTGMEGELLNDNAMPVNALASYQPMNTIRTSSGEYITPEGGRSAAPVMFGGNRLRQPVRTQRLSGDELTQMAILANRSPQQAAMATQRFLQANPDMANEPGFSGEELAANMSDNTFSNILGQRAKNAYAEQERMAAMAEKPSDRLAREKFEWEKSQASQAGPKMTEAQAKATTFASQMAAASNELDKLEQGGFDPNKTSSQLQTGMAGGLGNVFTSPEAQQAKQTQNQWSEAFLRVKTGAAATKDEVELNNKTFFPQVGDSPEVIRQKRNMRMQAERDVLNMTGPGREMATKREQVLDAQPASTGAPKTGHIQDGYIFLGGDPADPKRWRKQ